MKEKNKIKSLQDLLEIIKVLNSHNKKIVFTNGCFDILHIGHIRLLKKAKSFGDILILGLNTDNSIKRIKGGKRPIVNGKDRAEILSSLESVDYVVFFDEDDPCNIISEIKPDVHVKGGDYDPYDYNNMPEAEIVHGYGGEVKIVNIIKGRSTTEIIEKIEHGRDQ